MPARRLRRASRPEPARPPPRRRRASAASAAASSAAWIALTCTSPITTRPPAYRQGAGLALLRVARAALGGRQLAQRGLHVLQRRTGRHGAVEHRGQDLAAGADHLGLDDV